ncbi:MAG: hypothetical protein P4N41_25835 [Negativicutes bacterium]|nr:hypothetical protein [Negativicutes bacterium]MDR3593097.1 hypothetical protein [Negativicutes bacterium]
MRKEDVFELYAFFLAVVLIAVVWFFRPENMPKIDYLNGPQPVEGNDAGPYLLALWIYSYIQ